MCLVRSTATIMLVGFLVCSTLFGQSAAPATQPQTFHVKGTITDPDGAVIPGVKVTFQGQAIQLH